MIKKIVSSVAAFLAVVIIGSTPVFAYTDFYTVKPGDSLWKIAHMYKVDINKIIEANDQVKNVNMIYVGQRLAIPVPSTSGNSSNTGNSGGSSQNTGTPSVSTSVQQQVLVLVNKERAKAGAPALTLNSPVSNVAQTKSQDMVSKNYFSHNSPTYGDPFTMLTKFGVKYSTAGENIAKGQKTPESVVTAWMNSEGHRKNILSTSFTQMGIGYVSGQNVWTQMFIRP